MHESNQKGNFIIVGWGLAGSVMAWQLYFNQKSFSVKDSNVNHSSRVAAGLVNPIVFKRLTKSWNADVLMSYSEDFYTKIEQELGIQLLSRKPILRVFASTEEANNWSSKQGDDRFSDYLDILKSDDSPNSYLVEYPFGIGTVNTYGNLDTVLFLDASKDFFLAKGIRFEEGFFNYSSLNINSNYIFCEGTGLLKNPYFNYLPMKPTHGETLIIQSNELNFEATLNKNMFVMRLADNLYKVGATYNWELDEPICTESARAELIERLESFTNFNYKIVNQQAGIRPTVLDRKPLIGCHPKFENAFIFNGLGTKGVMIAPYYSNSLFNLIQHNEALEAEVDIKRYENYQTQE